MRRGVPSAALGDGPFTGRQGARQERVGHSCGCCRGRGRVSSIWCRAPLPMQHPAFWGTLSLNSEHLPNLRPLSFH